MIFNNGAVDGTFIKLNLPAGRQARDPVLTMDVLLRSRPFLKRFYK